MPQIEVTLPSGARGKIRGLKGEEINLFANKQSSRRGRTAMQILKNVWIETIDPGPLYADEIKWDKAPSCDRFVALYMARIATYGPEYEFKYQCEDCRKRFDWVVDLHEDMEIKPLPDDSIDLFKAGNQFSTSIIGNEGELLEIKFSLLTPKLENKMDQVQGMAPKEKATASLAQRLVNVGVADVGNDKGPIKRWLNDLDAGAMLELIGAMDDADGGVQTEIEIDCPHCGHIMAVDLPLREEFWSPARRKRSTKS